MSKGDVGVGGRLDSLPTLGSCWLDVSSGFMIRFEFEIFLRRPENLSPGTAALPPPLLLMVDVRERLSMPSHSPSSMMSSGTSGTIRW